MKHGIGLLIDLIHSFVLFSTLGSYSLPVYVQNQLEHEHNQSTHKILFNNPTSKKQMPTIPARTLPHEREIKTRTIVSTKTNTQNTVRCYNMKKTEQDETNDPCQLVWKNIPQGRRQSEWIDRSFQALREEGIL